LVYEWKMNKYPIKAQEAGEKLEEIEKRYKGITPKIVVNEARDKDSLLHPCFEWDNQEAAEKYREVQAGDMIRNIVVIKVDDNEENEPIRAFVNIVDREDNNNKYISISVAVKDVDYNAQIIETAYKELLAFENKYKNLKEFSEVLKAIEKVKEGMNI